MNQQWRELFVLSKPEKLSQEMTNVIINYLCFLNTFTFIDRLRCITKVKVPHCFTSENNFDSIVYNRKNNIILLFLSI
jgi:hypothetical protein